MKYEGTTTLRTERLILRPLAPEDFDAAHSGGSRPENVRYMAWWPNDEEQTKASAQAGRVVLNGTETVIGSCGIYPDDGNDTGSIGWILHKN